MFTVHLQMNNDRLNESLVEAGWLMVLTGQPFSGGIIS